MIRALIVAVTLAVATFVIGGLVFVAGLLRVPDGPRSIYAWAPRAWARICLAVSGVRVVEHGLEHKGGARHIFVANHLGNYDVLALAARLDWIKFVAKAELFRIPLFGGAMLAAGMIPIERANRKAAFTSYTRATERIERGASVAVYPEGTRGRAYALRPFKKGPFVLAIQAQAPIVPVFVYGALEIQRKGEFKVHPGTIHLHYCPPIPTEGMTYDDRDELARLTYEAMAQCLQDRYGIASPPYRTG